jgi:hypothetical protein
VSDDTINLAHGDDMTWILDIRVGDFGVVKMENNDRAQITRRGDVHLET